MQTNPFEILDRRLSDLAAVISGLAADLKAGPTKQVLTPEELVEEYDLSLTWQNRHRSAGTIPFHKVGGKVFYHRQEIERWLTSQTK